MPISHKKPPERRQGHRAGRDIGTLTALPGRGDPAPAAPAGLSRTARDAWSAFWRSPVSQAVDRDADMSALYRWIEATNERERIVKVVRARPVVTGSQGQEVLNPLVKLLELLEASIRRAEAEFGMTPMARLRLGITLGQASQSLQDLLGDLDDLADLDDDVDDPRDAADTPRPATIAPRREDPDQ